MSKFYHFSIKTIVSLLEQETLTFIYPPPPPNSPDLNPVHYKISGEMWQQIYQAKVHDVDELKLDNWHGLEQSVINTGNAINKWC